VSGDAAALAELELTILMPCLNEAETIAACVDKARAFLAASGIAGEVLVADNGSTDASQAIALRHGARVVQVGERGYGAALIGGIAESRGRFVIMGDADDSYDFAALQPFVDRLRGGADVVMGNRFRGGIAPGAMPALHRYLGNPALSFLGRLFFGVRAGDFHCGLRGFDRDRLRALDLRTTGMEFASEMVVRAALAGYRIDEVATTLKPDGRTRRPHLRPWRDGWRHLRFLLIYSPRWLFLYPGLALLLAGVFGVAILLPGPIRIGGIGFDLVTLMMACLATLVGSQSVMFAIIARKYAAVRGLVPPSAKHGALLSGITLERVLLVALAAGLAGVIGVLYCVWAWVDHGFGAIEYRTILRIAMVSSTAVAAALQLAFTAFLSGVMDVGTR
jgi:glycosyltransferase involved in cell wall biosynthesis